MGSWLGGVRGRRGECRIWRLVGGGRLVLSDGAELDDPLDFDDVQVFDGQLMGVSRPAG
jgi:hypothetical protein